MAYEHLTKEELAMIREAVLYKAADVRRLVSGETREQVDKAYASAAKWDALVSKMGGCRPSNSR